MKAIRNINSMHVLLTLFSVIMALALWSSAKSAKINEQCYTNCFPGVGKVIDGKCHCAVNDSTWRLFGAVP
tara:strand:- start:1152 stop:1364 length:213 start_codon:yes stop_codon:yes gene_type:complete